MKRSLGKSFNNKRTKLCYSQKNWAHTHTHTCDSHISSQRVLHLHCMFSFSALMCSLQPWLSDLFVQMHKIILLHILWQDNWYFGEFHVGTHISVETWQWRNFAAFDCQKLLWIGTRTATFCRLHDGNLNRKLKLRIPLHMRRLGVFLCVCCCCWCWIATIAISLLT